MMEIDDSIEDICGMRPSQQLKAMEEATHKFVNRQYQVYEKVIGKLSEAGIDLVKSVNRLSEEEQKFIDRYFDEAVFPILTPFVADSSRPFPTIKSQSLNIGLWVKRKGLAMHEFAFVTIPQNTNRLIRLPGGNSRFFLLEELIRINIGKLFTEATTEDSFVFRISRNAEFDILLEEEGNILEHISKQVRARQWSDAIRLEVSTDITDRSLELLMTSQNLQKKDVYVIPSSLDLTFLYELYSDENLSDFRIEKFRPNQIDELAKEDILSLVSRKDVILFHPFDSFDPVIDFIDKASTDPDVIAIKQTLYRVSSDSRIVEGLIRAAKNGKQVTALIELKARFDEENNIKWAQMLEKAGCTVLYGSADLKTHCKIALVIKKENGKLAHYLHLATGNYNEVTAKRYTDIGLFTKKESFGQDADKIFNMLSGYSKPENLDFLSVAPYGLKNRLLQLINRERENAVCGKSARIRAKMNSLCDPDIIEALYEASSAGVKIDLVIRGICCLRPQLEAVSENIHVTSIVGNFLEHSRILSFENNGKPEYYCSSADWMPRNLERRVELMFPVVEEENKEKLNQTLTMLINDNCKAYSLSFDGKYSKVIRESEEEVNSQILLKGIV